MSVPFLKSLQALQLAIQLGALKSAADRLSITPAAVGQRIKVLEDYLGVELIVRGRSGIRPTRELERALPNLDAAFRELAAVSDILDFQRVQEIHIVADSDFVELWLEPRLAAFKAENPNILFCINGVGDVPLRLGAADCEIWFGPSRNRTVEDDLFPDYLLPVSSPENTSRISTLPNDRRLEGFPLLHLDCYAEDTEALGWPQWIARFGHRTTATERGIRYHRIAHALDAVYSDAGLILCGLGLVSRKLDEGRLMLPFPLSEGSWTSEGYRVSFNELSLRRSQLAQFREWLLSESAAADENVRCRLATG